MVCHYFFQAQNSLTGKYQILVHCLYFSNYSSFEIKSQSCQWKAHTNGKIIMIFLLLFSFKLTSFKLHYKLMSDRKKLQGLLYLCTINTYTVIFFRRLQNLLYKHSLKPRFLCVLHVTSVIWVSIHFIQTTYFWRRHEDEDIYHVVSCRGMSCRVMFCRVVSCHFMSCHVVSRHDMPCYDMSCHVI